MITFGDSGPKPQDIPYDHAALYSDDCDYPCPDAVADRWAPVDVRWITFTGKTACSIADYEPGTEVYETPSKLRRWARGREGVGLAIVYSDQADVKSAAAALGKVPRKWLIATDNKDENGQYIQYTADQLSVMLREKFGVDVPAEDIWGNQYDDGNTFDTSNCYGDWR